MKKIFDESDLKFLIQRLSTQPLVDTTFVGEDTAYDFSPGGGMAIFSDGSNLYLTSFILEQDTQMGLGWWEYDIKTFSLTGGSVSSISSEWCWRWLSEGYGSNSSGSWQINQGNQRGQFVDFGRPTIRLKSDEYILPNLYLKHLYLISYYYTCFMEGTKITMADGSVKNIEKIQPGDMVKFLSDEGEEKTTQVMLPVEEFSGETREYTTYTFDNGINIDICKEQKLWNEDKKDYTNIEDWPIGTHTKTLNGEIITLTRKENHVLAKPKKHYFLQTWNGNYTVNNLLTYTSQDTIWNNLSKEEYRQYWKSDDEMKKQKRKVLTRRYKGTPTNFKIFQQTKMENLKKETSINNNINENKQYLSNTDYMTIKFADGVLTEEEYLPVKQKRAEARNTINADEAILIKLKKENTAWLNKFTAKTLRDRDSTQGGESLVLMADGTTKSLETINAGDKVYYFNKDNQLAITEVMLPPEPELVWDYYQIALENGSVLRMSGRRRIYNASKKRYCTQKECRVGEELLLSDGSLVKIINIENIELEDPQEFYRLNTRSGHYILNGVGLNGNPLRNYEEMLYEEHEYWRPSEEFMNEWKKEIENNK